MLDERQPSAYGRVQPVVRAGGRAVPRSRLRLGVYAFVAAVLVTVLLAGAATGAFASLGRDALYATGVYRDGGASTVSPGFFTSPVPSSSDTVRGPDEPVLPTRKPGQVPKASVLASQIEALPDEGIGTRAYAVGDPRTGKVITSTRAGTGVLPASALKLLTSIAVLDAYGPDHRFTTRVVSPRVGSVVLVGGGDPYLASARANTYPARPILDDLADQVVAKLKKAGTTKTAITLDWDATLFAGPDWNPTWPRGYSDQTTPTSALWVDEGRKGGGSPGPRESEPAQVAAADLVAELKSRGLRVSLGTTATAPSGASSLARVASMPLAQIVQEVLLRSDNDAAEVLFRHVALADDKAGSITEARKAVERRLTKLHVWTDGTVVHDGSGLSRDDRVETTTFLGLLELALSDDHPQYRSLITGLPVAGADGSLRYRFFASGTQAARGDVHAKTGTLTGVHSLVGYATTADGRLVAFAFVVNDAQNDYSARNWLDRAAATVAACGC